MDIKTFAKPEEAALFAGYALNKLLEDNKDKPVLLMLSGGSALEILDGVNPENLGEHTAISMLDERFSTEPAANNFLQLQKTDFYKEAMNRQCSFFGTLPRPGENKKQLAERLEKNLHAWQQENDQGKIFATVGMGPDGHIAGIMPFPEDEKKFAGLFLGKGWAVAYDAGDKSPHSDRITATATFLKNIDAAIAYIAGKEKQTVWGRIKQKANQPFELPAILLHDMRNLEIYTDLA
jgi:6-phosphogluconolactonase/glucosamine-6-phosphate isomerase/deaminase